MQLHTTWHGAIADNLARCNCRQSGTVQLQTIWRGAIARNLARFTARIGAIAETVITTPKLRRCYFQIAGHITRSARKVKLHLEEYWPYRDKFLEALDRIRKFEIAIT
ncbi:transposase [Acidithrix ferrooxidans]|uniref:transposase n=1 Tax=Acidithrix ferrooxidans TaxID=1280514 RepID=UPI001269E97E|nr:transposase [Acidithrix ferrooxidans]